MLFACVGFGSFSTIPMSAAGCTHTHTHITELWCALHVYVQCACTRICCCVLTRAAISLWHCILDIRAAAAAAATYVFNFNHLIVVYIDIAFRPHIVASALQSEKVHNANDSLFFPSYLPFQYYYIRAYLIEKFFFCVLFSTVVLFCFVFFAQTELDKCVVCGTCSHNRLDKSRVFEFKFNRH